MRTSESATRRCGWTLGAGLLLGGATVAILLTAGPAAIPPMAGPAAAATPTCSPSTPASSCTMSGSFGLTTGSLGVAAPASLTWSAALTGYNLTVVDPTDTTYTADDSTGTGGGWDITAAATTFTAGTHTLANSGTFSTTGSTSSAAATTAPSDVCASNATCVLPTESSVTYPVAITTAASSPTPVKIYNATSNTGMGAVTIGSTTPVGWWLTVPASASYGTYTSTITLAMNTGP
jgi:hypothetical protein